MEFVDGVSPKATSYEGESMTAKGTFEVDLLPRADADSPAGRMIINKTYTGDIIGSGKGQLISKSTEDGHTYGLMYKL